MNFIQSLINKIQGIFMKKEIKKIEEKKSEYVINESSDFHKRLKKEVKGNEKKRINTLVCKGDGTGIDNNVSY